jgi:arabinofuranan 3-O-arabinosyltransferase
LWRFLVADRGKRNMSEIRRLHPNESDEFFRPLGIFSTWRLQAYGYTLAMFYAAFFVYAYWLGVWLLNKSGVPLYHDFTNMFVAGSEALHGKAGSVYDPVQHLKAQEALVGVGHPLFSNWPYPPTYLLILAPLALLPYVAAFLIFETVTLVGYICVVYHIVRRSPAIPLLLASPFTAWNFLAGQSGFLTASLIGAALLFVERRPALAGVFIGCLTYKPQFGMLFPVALIAANQWRSFMSATATAAFLAGTSTSSRASRCKSFGGPRPNTRISRMGYSPDRLRSGSAV